MSTCAGRAHRAGERDSRCERREGRGRAARRRSAVWRAVADRHHVSGWNVNADWRGDRGL